jgi:hypothetical protein
MYLTYPCTLYQDIFLAGNVPDYRPTNRALAGVCVCVYERETDTHTHTGTNNLLETTQYQITYPSP